MMHPLWKDEEGGSRNKAVARASEEPKGGGQKTRLPMVGPRTSPSPYRSNASTAEATRRDFSSNPHTARDQQKPDILTEG